VIGPGDLDLGLLGVAEQARRDREQALMTYVQVPVEPRISHDPVGEVVIGHGSMDNARGSTERQR
jgi:hypothetical protein